MTNLDASQRAFCEAPVGNIRLLAPAGCGKTLCLLYRCAHLASSADTARPRFLIVTFTRAATEELKTRLSTDDTLSHIRDTTEITTLNAWGWRRVRDTTIGANLITKQQDKQSLVLNHLQPIWEDCPSVKGAIVKNKRFAPRKILDAIDSLKSLGFDHLRHADFDSFCLHIARLRDQQLGWRLDGLLDELTRLAVLSPDVDHHPTSEDHTHLEHLYEAFYTFWIKACEHLQRSATFTLEDQKYIAYLDEQHKLNGNLSGAASFDHIFVDEFQDINPLDLNLIRSIVARRKATVTLVGDDDQAIYEWRGATPEYILNPDRYFDTKFETYILHNNYRSPANIVDLSQRLIAHNTRRVPKNVQAADPGSNMADLNIYRTKGIADAVTKAHELFVQTQEMSSTPIRVAILSRTRSQLIPYQVYFASQDISFCAAEDLQVLFSKAFKELLELLAIKTRTGGRQLKRQLVDDILILASKVKRYPVSRQDSRSLKRHLVQAEIESMDDAIEALATYRGTLKGPNKEGRMSQEMAIAVQAFVDSRSVTDSLLTLSESFSGLQTDFRKAEDDIFFTDPPLYQLAEYAERYGSDYIQFMQDIENAREQLAHIPPLDEDSSLEGDAALFRRPLHLMTALRAKGQEFDMVVLLGVKDGIWPHKNATTLEQREAERRVFYVAFTRAKKRVVMLLDREVGDQESALSPYVEELGLSPDGSPDVYS